MNILIRRQSAPSRLVLLARALFSPGYIKPELWPLKIRPHDILQKLYHVSENMPRSNLLGYVSGSEGDQDNIVQQENIRLYIVQGHGKSLPTFIYANIANFYCTKILNYYTIVVFFLCSARSMQYLILMLVYINLGFVEQEVDCPQQLDCLNTYRYAYITLPFLVVLTLQKT